MHDNITIITAVINIIIWTNIVVIMSGNTKLLPQSNIILNLA
jgi:hypothetical protein